jgi:hypothetical protein
MMKEVHMHKLEDDEEFYHVSDLKYFVKTPWTWCS